MLNHVMIDLETMGRTPGSAIVSVGAVIFDPRIGKKGAEFYAELDWEHQDRLIDPETQRWWSRQSEEAKKALSGLEELKECLGSLAKFLPRDAKVWGNGPTFDISMLEDGYRQYGIEVPWKFWNIRDCRTVLDMYESTRGGTSKSMRGKVQHNALDDAIAQAKAVSKMWRLLCVPK